MDRQSVTDVAYATTSSAQRLDLHRPHDPAGVVPVIVDLHGGAFRFGDRTMDAELIAAVVSAGFAVASVDYRLSGEALFPAAVLDVKAAVRYLRARADEFGIDPDRIGAFGRSAGGHLAAMLGVSASIDRFDDPALGNRDRSSAVAAVAAWFAPIDFLTMDDQHRADAASADRFQSHDAADSPESRWLGAPIQTIPERAREASPIAYLDDAEPLPPFLLAHGDRDDKVPGEQTRQFADVLRRRGAPVTHRVVAGAGHGRDFAAADELPHVIAFFDRHLR